MNKIKDIFLNDSVDISGKLYIVFTTASVLICLGLFFVNAMTTAAFDVTLITWGLVFIQGGMIIFAVYKRNFYLPSLISCILINYFAFPYVFFSGNLFFGSVPIWMMVGYAYSGMVLTKKTKIGFIFLQSVINISCFIVAFSMDWTLFTNRYSYSLRLVDCWFAVIAGGAVLFAMASFNNWLNLFEEKIVLKQTDEIVNLYQNQSRFFSSMSHEIRTPINTIMGLNEANLSLNPGEDILDYSMEIKYASNKLLSLINDILDISKLQSGKMEVVEAGYNLSDMISLITDEVWKESYDRGLKLNIFVDPDTPNELFGDEIRIRQVVRNILIKSFNITETGSVNLQIRFEELKDNRINLIFDITDTGKGIRREELPYVFDVYRQSEDEKTGGEGTGLELPIAKRISDIMGGKLEVDSIYSRGSRYRFSITQKVLSDSKAPKTFEERENKKDYSNFTAGKARILVVDDDGMNLNVFKKMFGRVFLNIDTVTGGEEAIGLCADNEYDLIFIDHLMPKMNGVETLEGIRKIRKDVPAIALTANTGSDARALYREAGFADYLSKPIDKEYALRIIYKLLPESMIVESEAGGKYKDTFEAEYVETKRIPLIITTDSVADMPEYMLGEYNIPIIPFYVNTSEGKRYKDGEEISSESLISFINNDDRYAFSEPPNESEYEIFFGEVLRKADKILHLATAKNSSSAYSIAKAASKSFANVEVMDSGQVGFGLAILAMESAKLAALGADTSEIKKKIRTDREKIVFDFIVDETRNLAATGRIPLVIHRMCSFFNIHPVIHIKNSKLTIRTVKVGDINKIRDRYYKKLRKRRDISEDFLALLNSDLDQVTTERLQKELTEHILTNRFVTVIAGPAVASNSGRGAFGICYRKK